MSGSYNSLTKISIGLNALYEHFQDKKNDPFSRHTLSVLITKLHPLSPRAYTLKMHDIQCSVKVGNIKMFKIVVRIDFV